jgi:glycosidase
MNGLKSLFIALSLTFICGMSSFAGKIKLDHVEPMFWWANMTNPELQVMVHGEKISDCNVEINYSGVTVERVIKTDNPNYLFINILIDKSAKAGTFDILFTDNGKTKATYKYELKERRSGSADRKGFDTSDVFYLIMPDRFSNGNPDNDSVDGMADKLDRENPDGRHGGDIQGIINHLDYLQELGITAIWNTPMMEDNMPKVSYHTYAISDFYKIDARYGTNDDYARLSAEAKKRGIKLVIDIVTNHAASEHWMMKDLPTKDWIHIFPEFTNSNHRKTTTNDPYVANVDYRKNFDGWFDTSMADLNQKNDLLLTYLTQNTIWWIEFADLGGVRIDTYPYNDTQAMAEYCNLIMDEYPNFNIVGETWLFSPADIAYWQKGANNNDGYESGLPSVMDFPLMNAMHKAFDEKESWNQGLIRLYNSLASDYLYPDRDNLFTFLENHDTDRVMTIMNGDINKFKMSLAFLLTTRGIPQLYYGGEIMMEGRKSDGDGVMRIDFPGGWEGDERNAFIQEDRTDLENEAFNFQKKLLNYRKNNPVLHTGELKHFVPENDTYVYFRSNKEKMIMVLLNNSDEFAKTIDCKRFDEVMANFKSAKNVMTDEQLNDISTIEVPAKSVMILELN